MCLSDCVKLVGIVNVFEPVHVSMYRTVMLAECVWRIHTAWHHLSDHNFSGYALCCAVHVVMLFDHSFVCGGACPTGTATFTNLGMMAPQGVSVTISASCNWLAGGTVTGSWLTSAATLLLTLPAGVPLSVPISNVNVLNPLTPPPVVQLGTVGGSEVPPIPVGAVACTVAFGLAPAAVALTGTLSVPLSSTCR